MEAYQGGTCNETDNTARICVHLAMAAQAEECLQNRVWVLMKATQL